MMQSIRVNPSILITTSSLKTKYTKLRLQSRYSTSLNPTPSSLNGSATATTHINAFGPSFENQWVNNDHKEEKGLCFQDCYDISVIFEFCVALKNTLSKEFGVARTLVCFEDKDSVNDVAVHLIGKPFGLADIIYNILSLLDHEVKQPPLFMDHLYKDFPFVLLHPNQHNVQWIIQKRKEYVSQNLMIVSVDLMVTDGKIHEYIEDLKKEELGTLIWVIITSCPKNKGRVIRTNLGENNDLDSQQGVLMGDYNPVVVGMFRTLFLSEDVKNKVKRIDKALGVESQISWYGEKNLQVIVVPDVYFLQEVLV